MGTFLSRFSGKSVTGSSAGRAQPSPVRPRVTARGGLGTIADLIAVATALVAIWSLLKGPLPQSILAVALGLLALAFMALSFHLQRQQAAELAKEKRRSRHAESLKYLAESAAALRDATAMLGMGEPPSSFTHPAQIAASKLADAMTAATGVKCRVVVKTVYAPGGREDVAVRTFVSSDAVPNRRNDDGIVDWVKENTDFDEIFYQNHDYFLSNDLAKELGAGYRNSHFTKGKLQGGFPYLSTLVWPIFGPQGAGSYDVIGFLCVDTEGSGSFDHEADVVVGETMASLWYLALERYGDAVQATSRPIDHEAPALQGGVSATDLAGLNTPEGENQVPPA